MEYKDDPSHPEVGDVSLSTQTKTNENNYEKRGYVINDEMLEFCANFDSQSPDEKINRLNSIGEIFASRKCTIENVKNLNLFLSIIQSLITGKSNTQEFAMATWVLTNSAQSNFQDYVLPLVNEEIINKYIYSAVNDNILCSEQSLSFLCTLLENDEDQIEVISSTITVESFNKMLGSYDSGNANRFNLYLTLFRQITQIAYQNEAETHFCEWVFPLYLLHASKLAPLTREIFDEIINYLINESNAKEVMLETGFIHGLWQQLDQNHFDSFCTINLITQVLEEFPDIDINIESLSNILSSNSENTLYSSLRLLTKIAKTGNQLVLAENIVQRVLENSDNSVFAISKRAVKALCCLITLANAEQCLLMASNGGLLSIIRVLQNTEKNSQIFLFVSSLAKIVNTAKSEGSEDLLQMFVDGEGIDTFNDIINKVEEEEIISTCEGVLANYTNQ